MFSNGSSFFLHERFDLSVTALFLRQGEDEPYALLAQAGRYTYGPNVTITSSDRGVVARAVRTGEPQLVLDVGSDPDYVKISPEAVAEYAVPIILSGTILGALNLESASTKTFSTENLLAFQMLARQVAGAIQMAAVNQRLIETNRLVEQRTRELELANRKLQEANESLLHLSAMDGLTGLANRRELDMTLDVEWRRGFRAESALSLLMVDIDWFKRFNDAYGHLRGDDCLRQVAASLRQTLQRASDFVGRFGGEEFAAILPGVGHEDAIAAAEMLRAAVESLRIEHRTSSTAPYVTVSIGVATIVPSESVTPNEFVAAADRGLYAAKSAGRNCVRPA